MRSRSFLIALPVVAALCAPAASAQVMDDVVIDDVEYVSGTGENIESGDIQGEDVDRGVSEPFAGPDDESEILNVADKISDPVMQDGVAAAVERTTSAMMQIPIGPFVQAIENARPGTVNRRLRRDATVADVAGRDAEDLPERLGDSSREMMGMMGGFARAMAVMMPEFERMGREMEESVRAAKAAAKRN